MNASGESSQPSEQNTEHKPEHISEHKSEQVQEKSFMRELFNRRVPHIIGVYLAGSWGLIQFIDWMVSRYVLSPYLVDLSAVVLASLIPSTFMVAYFHGKPGRDRWKRTEKVIVPMNLILTITLVVFLFGGKDLSSMAREVTLTDETGKEITRVVPKSRYRKKVALFFFENETGDAKHDWMQYGLTVMTAFDLEQDMFIETITPLESDPVYTTYYIYEKMKKAGYNNAVGLPLLLKKKFAEDYRMKYFLSGKIIKAPRKKGEYAVEISLYRTKNTKLAASKTYRGNDLFALVDQITVDLKHNLDIPSGHIEKQDDLPLKESLTHSVPAVREFSLGIKARLIGNDLEKAARHLEKAVAIDPNFASAYLMLSEDYILQGNEEKYRTVYSSVMKLLYKLSERQQFIVKIGYYGSKQDAKKQIAVVNMLIKLYPEDIAAHTLKALLYSFRDRAKAVEAYKRILELEPDRYSVYRKIGDMYEKMGQLQEALSAYKSYAEHYPTDYKPCQDIAGIQTKIGDLQAAKQYYDKALVIQPENIFTLRALAGIEVRLGNHEQALEQYMEIMTLCKTPNDRGMVYHALRHFYKTKGQTQKALEYGRRYLDEYKQHGPTFLVTIVSMYLTVDYVEAGKEDEAFRLLEQYKSKFTAGLDKLPAQGYVPVYLKLGKPEEAEKYLPDFESIIKMTDSVDLKFAYKKAQAMIHHLKGNYNDAVPLYEEALTLNPYEEETMILLGACAGKLKDYDKAEEWLKKVLKMFPYHPEANLEMAQIHFDRGNEEEGLKHLQIALQVWKDADPHYKPAQKAKELMARHRTN